MFGAIGSAMAGAFGGGGNSPSAAGGGLKNALMQRAMQPAAGAAMGAGMSAPPSQSNGLWSKMLGTNKQSMNGSQPPQQGGAMAAGGPPQGMPPPAPTPMAGALPAPAMPPNPQPKIPSAMNRWTNGQQIQQAFANGWQPNPMLLRASLGK